MWYENHEKFWEMIFRMISFLISNYSLKMISCNNKKTIIFQLLVFSVAKYQWYDAYFEWKLIRVFVLKGYWKLTSISPLRNLQLKPVQVNSFFHSEQFQSSARSVFPLETMKPLSMNRQVLTWIIVSNENLVEQIAVHHFRSDCIHSDD